MGSFEFDLKPHAHNKKMKVILSSLVFAALVLSTRGQNTKDCAMCMKLADLWDKFDSSSKGLKAGTQAVQKVICDDDDCQKNRLKMIMPVASAQLNTDLILKSTCVGLYGCLADTYDANVKITCDACRQMSQEFVSALNSAPNRRAAVDIIQTNNNKVLTFFQDVGSEIGQDLNMKEFCKMMANTC